MSNSVPRPMKDEPVVGSERHLFLIGVLLQAPRQFPRSQERQVAHYCAVWVVQLSSARLQCRLIGPREGANPNGASEHARPFASPQPRLTATRRRCATMHVDAFQQHTLTLGLRVLCHLPMTSVSNLSVCSQIRLQSIDCFLDLLN